MSLTAEIRASIAFNQTGANDFGPARLQGEIETLIQIASGTGANQADILFVDERSIAASTNDDLDLAGVLSSAFGATIASAELVAILIINKPKDPATAANLSSLTIGLGTNPVTPGFMGGTLPTVGPIKPGGVFLLASPDAAGLGVVTGGSADLLRIANGSGGTALVQVAILARTA